MSRSAAISGFFRRAGETPGAERAFTLVEILVVVAIVSIVAAFAVRRISGIAESSRETAAESDLKTIAAAIADPENGYLADMRGIPGFSPACIRIGNLFAPTNIYGAVAHGAKGARGTRVDDPGSRAPGAAAPEAFTRWDADAERGWRGPYLRAASMEFPSAGDRRDVRDATFRERGFFPGLSGLWLPDDFLSGKDGCSIYGFPGEIVARDPWGNPYVLQIPPPQAFEGGATNVADDVRFSYARVVSAGPDGRLSTPCFDLRSTNAAASAWNPWRRRMSRQAGLDTGGDRSLRGDDLVYFLFRADIDEGDGL